jgi:abortive infection bacteriophage resistance protein
MTFMTKNFKKIDGLMKHLRNSGINIKGSYQKRQLVNYGYYHGYKGYRFFSTPTRKIPFTDFKQIIAVIKYDNNIKALCYPHLMFIETALKNITLDIVLQEAKSNLLNDIFDRLMPGYHNAPSRKKDVQRAKLQLHSSIRYSLFRKYNKNNIITHFYNSSKYSDVPIWAVFEILTLGDFGFFVSCLNKTTREKISRYMKLDLSGDTNRTLVQDIIFVIKDFRNAVAHNDIVFDTRFNRTEIARPLEVCLTHEVGVTYVNFESIIDYLILVCYILKKIKVPKREIQGLISAYQKGLDDLQKEINSNIYHMIVHTDTGRKINDLRNFIKT